MNLNLNTLTVEAVAGGYTEEINLIVNGVHVADIAITAYTENDLPGVRLAVTGYTVAENDDAENVCEIDANTERRPGWIIPEPAEMPSWFTENLPVDGWFAWRNA